jgi:preprotein translocase subunit SecG
MTETFFFIVMVLFIFICVILVLLVLIQKGRGGGLSSAFGGGGGGSTAFGAKTGDVLTWATSIVFGLFIALAVVLNLLSDHVGNVPKSPTVQMPINAPASPGGNLPAAPSGNLPTAR